MIYCILLYIYYYFYFILFYLLNLLSLYIILLHHIIILVFTRAHSKSHIWDTLGRLPFSPASAHWNPPACRSNRYRHGCLHSSSDRSLFFGNCSQQRSAWAKSILLQYFFNAASLIRQLKGVFVHVLIWKI